MLTLDNGVIVLFAHIMKVGLVTDGRYEIVLSNGESEHIYETHKTRASLLSDLATFHNTAGV